MSIATITTAEELLRAGDIGRCELVRGELKMMSPANPLHARIVARLTYVLLEYLGSKRIGEILSGDPGFTISRDPDTVRAPDIAFVKQDRLKLFPKRGFFPGPPDLAVEVLSPGDTASEVFAKVQDWLESGCASVWIVDPERNTISIHRLDKPVVTFTENQTLTDEPMFPGLRLPLAELFR